MSVIIGIETPNYVIIGSDSQSTTMNGAVASSAKLISATERTVVGLVGTLHWQKWVVDALSTSSPDPEELADRFLACPLGLTPERALEWRWLLANMPEDGVEEGCGAMIATPLGLYLVDGAGVVPLVETDHERRLAVPVAMHALGSGGDFALGAALTHLAILSQLKNEYDDEEVLRSIVVNAVDTARRLDPGCSGAVRLRIYRKSAYLPTEVPNVLRGRDDEDDEDDEDDDTDEDVH